MEKLKCVNLRRNSYTRKKGRIYLQKDWLICSDYCSRLIRWQGGFEQLCRNVEMNWKEWLNWKLYLLCYVNVSVMHKTRLDHHNWIYWFVYLDFSCTIILRSSVTKWINKMINWKTYAWQKKKEEREKKDREREKNESKDTRILRKQKNNVGI